MMTMTMIVATTKLSLAVASKLQGDPTKEEGDSRKVMVTMMILMIEKEKVKETKENKTEKGEGHFKE